MSSPPVWQEAILRAVRDLTPDIREFEIVPSREALLPFAPGAHLEIEVMVRGEPERRAYSLVGEPDGAAYRIAVKQRAESRGGSSYLHALKPGARLRIGSPKSAFSLSFSNSEYLLIAGGIGVTPLVGMAAQLARRGAAFRMLYAARSEADFAYLDTLEATAPGCVETFCRRRGRALDLRAEFDRLASDALVALCGPLTLLDDARRAWREAGRPTENLRWETFGSSGHFAAEDFRVRIPRHGLEIVVPRDRTLLEALNAAGIDVMHECRKGECGLCAMEVLGVEGEIDHRDFFFSEEQHHAGDRLCACVSRARGTLTLDTDFRPDTL